MLPVTLILTQSMATTVKPHQCLLDIVLRESGNTGTLFELALHNGLHITEDLSGGQQLKTEEITVIDQSVIHYYRTRNIYPGTSLTIQRSGTRPGGVNYMGIGIDFKIS